MESTDNRWGSTELTHIAFFVAASQSGKLSFPKGTADNSGGERASVK